MEPQLLFRLINRLSMLMALIAGAAVLILSVLIVFDIVSRSLFSFSVQGTDELGGYTLALIGSLGLTYTLLQRGHPRIDIALRHLKSGFRRILHVVAYGALCLFAIFMAQHAIGEFSETLAFGTVTNTPLQTPLWVPQVFWVAGTVVFALVTLVLTIHGIFLLCRTPEAIDRFYGPITVEEEVQEYLADDPSHTLKTEA